MKKLSILVFVLFLFGCTNNENIYSDATNASRAGLALINEAKDMDEGPQREEKHKQGREKLKEAKSHYETLLKQAPDNGYYNNNYGWVLMQLGEYDKAKEYFEIAMKYEDDIISSNTPSKNLEELQARSERQK